MSESATNDSRSLTDLYRALGEAGDAWLHTNYGPVEGRVYCEVRDEFWHRLDSVGDGWAR